MYYIVYTYICSTDPYTIGGWGPPLPPMVWSAGWYPPPHPPMVHRPERLVGASTVPPLWGGLVCCGWFCYGFPLFSMVFMRSTAGASPVDGRSVDGWSVDGRLRGTIPWGGWGIPSCILRKVHTMGAGGTILHPPPLYIYIYIYDRGFAPPSPPRG